MSPPNVFGGSVVYDSRTISFLNMEESASDTGSASIKRDGKGLAFSGGKNTPRNISIPSLRSFFEFDDLQSLEWTVEHRDVPLSTRYIGLAEQHDRDELEGQQLLLGQTEPLKTGTSM